MSALTVPFVVIGVAVTVPVFAFGVRRLLGLRVSPPALGDRRDRGVGVRFDQGLGAVAPVDEQLGHLMPPASWTSIHLPPPLLFCLPGLSPATTNFAPRGASARAPESGMYAATRVPPSAGLST